MSRRGFPTPLRARQRKTIHPGVFLTDGQPSGYYTTLIEVRIPEEAVLPFEWPEEASAARNFYVPAAIVNRAHLGPPPDGSTSSADAPPDTESSENEEANDMSDQ